MKGLDNWVDELIGFAEVNNMTLDEVYHWALGVDEKTFAMVVDNPSCLPRKMKSKVSP